MKYISVLLLCALLLCGCEAGSHGLRSLPPDEIPEAVSTAPAEGLYTPGSAIETRTAGAVKAFPLPMADAYGLRMLGEDLLVFSGSDRTTLTRLSGPELRPSGEITLPVFLSPDDPSLSIGSDTLSYYAENYRELVVLDTALREVERYPLPEEQTGTPILSPDRETLYYCTESAVMAWDLREGLHRTLNMMSYAQQTLQGLSMDGSILQCRILEDGQEETLLLSTENGRQLYRKEGALTLCGQDGFYYASFPSGMLQTLLFGSDPACPSALIPEDLYAAGTFLPGCQGAITVSDARGGQIRLQYYDLSTGKKGASLSLPEAQKPASFAGTSYGLVYVLVYEPEFDSPAIYGWDCTAVGKDPTVYTDRYRTEEDPDLEALRDCQAYADALSEKYGLKIRIWKDASAVEPWDYRLETEFSAPVIRAELTALDQHLSHYPKKLLADTADHFSSLSICLVRQLTGRVQSGSLDTAIGIQFVEGTDAYLVLAAGKYAEHSLYHEFFHLMETHILGTSTAFDRWEKLNPGDFAYAYSYTGSPEPDETTYLHGENRAFVDSYSMSFPKEDRARIMEYAMLPGNAGLFRSSILRRKLLTICSGIRDAYDLEDSEETFLWEQYLNQ